MATSRKSDLQRQLRELDEQRARLMAELRASEQESAPPPSDEDDLVNEGIKFPDGTRDGDDDGKERSKSQCTAERRTTPRPPSPRPLTTEPPRDLVAAPRPVAARVVQSAGGGAGRLGGAPAVPRAGVKRFRAVAGSRSSKRAGADELSAVAVAPSTTQTGKTDLTRSAPARISSASAAARTATALTSCAFAAARSAPHSL